MSVTQSGFLMSVRCAQARMRRGPGNPGLPAPTAAWSFGAPRPGGPTFAPPARRGIVAGLPELGGPGPAFAGRAV